MPNHCYNKLSIFGKEEDLKKVQDFVKDDGEKVPFSCEKVIPFPHKEWKVQPGYTEHGYAWAIGAWGTKWGAYDFEDGTGEIVDSCYEDGRVLVYEFYSAWSPPTPVIKKLSEMFPTLLFELYSEESGVGYLGESVFQAGESVSDIVLDGKNLPSEIRRNLRGG